MVTRLVLIFQPISILHHTLFLYISSWSGWSPSSSLCCWTLTWDWLLPSDSQCSLSSSGHSCKNALLQGSHTHNYTVINTHTHTHTFSGCVCKSKLSIKTPKKTIKPSFLYLTTPKVLQLDSLLCFVCIPDRSTLCWGRSQTLTSTGHWRTTIRYGISHLCNLTA